MLRFCILYLLHPSLLLTDGSMSNDKSGNRVRPKRPLLVIEPEINLTRHLRHVHYEEMRSCPVSYVPAVKQYHSAMGCILVLGKTSTVLEY